MLIIDELTVTYGRSRVLDGLNFTFEDGKIYGIVGANGAGKSTLLNAISHYIDFDGRIWDTASSNYLEHLVYVPTDQFFYPKIKGIEHLRFFLQARRITHIDIGHWNTHFNLPLDHYVSTYSSGMRKKLGIMTSLLLPSRVYILDEPFNNLDVDTVHTAIELLKQHHAAHQNILIVTSHHLAYLQSMCDFIYELHADASLELVYRAEEGKVVTAKDEISPG